jgi:predicted RNA-binding protein YlxR (DUF448 family)
MMTTEHDDKNEQQDRPEKISGAVRSCAGCGKRDTAEALVRVVLGPESEGRDGGHVVAIDLQGGSFGRGAHVHPTRECFAKACKHGFSKAFKTKVADMSATLGVELVEAVDRRIEGLLGGANRSRQLAIGADAVVSACAEEKASLVIVAADAAAAAQLGAVLRAVDSGNAVVWGTKGQSSGPRKGLGSIFARNEVGVVAVLSSGVADAIRHAYVAARPFRSEAWWSPEVR